MSTYKDILRRTDILISPIGLTPSIESICLFVCLLVSRTSQKVINRLQLNYSSFLNEIEILHIYPMIVLHYVY